MTLASAPRTTKVYTLFAHHMGKQIQLPSRRISQQQRLSVRRTHLVYANSLERNIGPACDAHPVSRRFAVTFLRAVLQLIAATALAFFLLPTMTVSAAPTYVTGNINTCTATSCSDSLTGTNAGDTIVLGLFVMDSTAVSTVIDSLGNSYTPITSSPWTGGDGKTHYERLYYAKNSTSGSDTITVTLSGSVYMELRAYDYSGLDPSSPVDISATPATGNSTSPASESVTTTNANDLLFGYFHNWSAETVTPGAGFTGRPLPGDGGPAAEDENVGSVGSYSASMSYSGTSTYVAFFVAFKAADQCAETSLGGGWTCNSDVSAYSSSSRSSLTTSNFATPLPANSLIYVVETLVSSGLPAYTGGNSLGGSSSPQSTSFAANAGDSAFVEVSVYGTGTITSVTDSNGGSPVLEASKSWGSSSQFTDYIYLESNLAAGSHTVAVNFSGSPTYGVAIQAYDYSNVATSSPIDGSIPTPVTGTATSGTTNSITPSNANDLLFNFFDTDHDVSQSPESGWTARTVGGGSFAQAQDKIAGSTSAQTAEQTFSGSADYVGFVIALKPLGGTASCATPTDNLNGTFESITSASINGTSTTSCNYWYQTAQGGADAVTCNASGVVSAMGCDAVNISAPSGTPSVDQTCTRSNGSTSGGSNDASCSSGYTTTDANELNIAGSYGDATSTLAAGTNFTLVNSANLREEYYMQASAGAVTPEQTIDSGTNYAFLSVAFTTTGSGGGSNPIISGLSPTSGQVGASVTISGSNFGSSQGSSTVTFNGVTATPTSWSATTVIAAVPSGATTGNVVVTVGGTGSNGVNFTVSGGATYSIVQSIPCNADGASCTTQAITVTAGDALVAYAWSYNASNFSTYQLKITDTSGSNVWAAPLAGMMHAQDDTVYEAEAVEYVCNAAAGRYTFTLTPTYDTGSSGFAALGIAEVSGVSTSSGTGCLDPSVAAAATNTTANPSITSGSVSSSGDFIFGGLRNTGSDAGTPQQTNVLSWSQNFNIEWTIGPSSGTQTVGWSSPSGFWLGAVLGLAPAGSGGGSSPSILSLSPSSGPVGTSVTIAGADLGSTQGSSTVTFNGTSAAVTSWGSGTIVAQVPSGATTGSVVVTVAGTASNGLQFTVTATPPSISSLSPTSGSAGTSVTITGTNFGTSQGQSYVAFNGMTATVSSWSATSIVASVPSGATSGPAVVTVSGMSSLGVNFNIAPTITTISPGSGPVGAPVTITGTGFGLTQGTSTVDFNGVASSPASWSPTTIEVPVPPGASTGNVTVTVSGSTSSGLSFTVLPAPVITGISPNSGPVGTLVTVAGRNFGATQGTSNLTFNGISATPASWSGTQIVVPVPAGVTSGIVVVTVSAVASNGALFEDPSGFIPTGSLNYARFGQTATLLQNGLVLIAGGEAMTGDCIDGGPPNGDCYASTAELYNPATGTFTPTGSMVNPRMYHTATLLDDGIVLIVGGQGVDGSLSSAELYNPQTGTFSITGSLNVARFSHTASLLNNGMVLVAGGWGGGDGGSAQCSGELYNPATGAFTLTGSLNDCREYATATSLNDGKVLIAGGYNYDTLSTAELYDPSTGSFSYTGSLNSARYRHTATLLKNGSVLFAGGSFYDYYTGVRSLLSSTELYNPSTGTFTNTGPLNNARTDHTATLLNNGLVLVVGGVAPNFAELASAELYDPSVGVFSVTGNLNTARDTHTATLLSNGAVLVAGGYNLNGFNNQADDVYVSSAEMYQLISTAPTIGGVSPNSGPVSTAITISGINFGATQGNSTVAFNGVAASPTAWSPTSIVVPVPSGATSGEVVVTVAGVASNGIEFLVTAGSSPYITGLSPGSGLVGTSVAISGINFGSTQGTSTITFDGVLGMPTNWNDTQIVAPVPTGATSGNVIVTVGSTASNPVPFTVLTEPVPVISSLSPTSGPIGTVVTIAGSNFGSTQGTSTIAFDGIVAVVSAWGPTSVTATVPGNANTGPAVITVDGLGSNGVIFVVGPGPGITNLNPTSGAVGTSVVISGANFGSTQGTNTVTFDGVTATPTAWSATSITVSVPSGAISGPVIVAVNGITSNAVNFTVGSGPGITGLFPSAGPDGASITIAGVNFGSTQGASTVTFDGVLATPTSWSSTSIVLPVPAGAMTGNVVVTVGGTPSSGVLFIVTSAPVISYLSPMAGPIGSSVTITGLNLGAAQGSGTVTFNGASAAVTSWNPNAIVVTVPATAMTGNVVVTLTGGLVSNAVPFIVGTFPTVASLSPYSGNAGTSVTVSGANFGSPQGASTVTFNGVAATATSWTASSITASVPTGATTGPVVVTVGGLASNSLVFAVGSGPGILGISPGSGKVGASITISGVNFGSTQGSSTVTFNGVAASTTSWSASSITATVPTVATTGPVVVTVGGQVSNGFSFAVIQPPPIITSLSPTSGSTGTSVTINGSGFGSAPGVITFNGAPAVATSWSPTSIGATVPASATSGNVVVTVGGFSSNGIIFVVGTSPAIVGLNPTSGNVGTSVTITGANFGSSQGLSTVTFNGTVATLTSWGATAITASVPSGATTGNVVVMVGGIQSNGVLFVVGSGPGIQNLSPTAGPTGTPVTITGVNFGSTQGSSTVTFAGVQATVTSWSGTSLVVTVPATAQAGNNNVVVTVNSVASNAVRLEVSPYISGISHTEGPVQMGFVITGTSFGLQPSSNCASGQTCVALNGVPLTVLSWMAPPFSLPALPCPPGQQCTTITVQVPAAATTGNIVITVAGQPSNPTAFQVDPPFCDQAGCPF